MNTIYAYADVSSLEDEDLFAGYFEMMPAKRQEKINRFKYDKDKRLSLGAGILLRKLLLEAGAVDSQMQKVDYNDKGKPFFPDCPEYKFNLSHSGTKVVCAVSDYELGCDVEAIQCADMRLAKRFFSQAENEELEKCCYQEDRDRLFYRMWTLKESFLKAVGSGLSIELSSFSILFKNDGITIAQSVDQCCYLFKEFDLDPDYCFSLCIKRKEKADMEQIEVREILLDK